MDRISPEAGGAERIPAAARRGRPAQLLRTWASPALGLPALATGVISVSLFGLGLGQAAAAIVLGTALGAAAHGVLSSSGPRSGLPQLVQGRAAFGRGAALPAAVNAATAGVGWFAVQGAGGALALAALTGLPRGAALLLVVAASVAAAWLGLGAVHALQRAAFPVLATVFALGAVWVLGRTDLGAPGAGGGLGGLLLTSAAAFCCIAVWAPLAADHTRGLPEDASPLRTGLAAGLGLFLATTALMLTGAAAATAGAPDTGDVAADLTAAMPGPVGDLVLLGIALGAVCANAMLVYSGALSLLATGARLPRTTATLGLGALGLLPTWTGLADGGHRLEAYLLVAGYWVAPWLGVVLTARLSPAARPGVAGPAALVAGFAISVLLFSNQEEHVGLVPASAGGAGDLTPVAGFLLAALLYLALGTLSRAAAPAKLDA